MSLLKQAIADAKAVKDVAERNAIATLTEAFAPQMTSMLSRKLSEEDMEDDELDLPIEEVDDELEDSDTETEAPIEDTPPAPPAEDEMEDEDDADLDEVLRELEGSDGMEDEMPIEEADDEEMMDDDPIDEIIGEVEDEMAADEPEDDEEMKTENVKLKRKLKEAFKVINTQKSVLNEVGVLNAKLLFTTKILSKYGNDLSESQKMKILEAFDRANNLRETRLIYTTICSGLNKNTKTKKIAESKGVSSKGIKSVGKPITEQATPTNEFIHAERWKFLAGIK